VKIYKVLLTTLLLVAGVVHAAGEPAASLSKDDAGEIWFATAGSIVRGAAGKPYEIRDESITLSGDLQFPTGTGPVPAVILAHGCAGNGYAELTWVPILREWGYATFVVNSFSGRDISSICADVWRLRSLQRVPDVYGALRVLATHPKIDANRIALMGFSHGGTLSLNAATGWARDKFAPEGRPRFRAFFPFYPFCNFRYPEFDQISAPLRIHSGELDDWTPAKTCHELAGRLKAKGYDASITIYPGAHHAFDHPSGGVMRLWWGQNISACNRQYASILGPFDVANDLSDCLTLGATVGRNADALKLAMESLRAQLKELLDTR
jgi:dienelactone hydrolase